MHYVKTGLSERSQREATAADRSGVGGRAAKGNITVLKSPRVTEPADQS